MRIIHPPEDIHESEVVCKNCRCLFAYWPIDMVMLHDGARSTIECPACGWFNTLSDTSI